jgi:hypothetical protein
MRAITQVQASDWHELQSRGARSRLAQQQLLLPKQRSIASALEDILLFNNCDAKLHQQQPQQNKQKQTTFYKTNWV